MSMPKSVIKFKKGEVEFISNVDRAKYLLVELERAALKDVAKVLRRRMIEEGRKQRGLKNFKAKRVPNAFQFWVRRIETDLQVGIKHNTWYGVEQELGSSNQPKRGILRNTTYDNIDLIRVIQGKYLSSIEDENRAIGLVNEDEEVGEDA